jgi:hypothetical protein
MTLTYNYVYKKTLFKKYVVNATYFLKLSNNVKIKLNKIFLRNGLEPEKIFKMISIMTLVSERGIDLEDLQNYNNLFAQLCLDSDFSIMDHNIDNIVNEINRAKNS